MKFRKAAVKLINLSWSFADQGVVSAGNFLLNMFLARVLTPRSYGTFAMFYLATLGANTIHSSVVTYWLSVTGANANGVTVRRLLIGALAITSVWALPFSLIILIASVVVHDFSLWIPATIAMVAWQWQESARRGLLCQARYRSAVLPDALSYLGQAAIVGVLRPTSLLVVFWVMAITSILGLLWQGALIGVGKVTIAGLKSDFVESFHLGRFIAVANGMNMLILQIPSWSLLASTGKGGVAAFQALMNVVGAANPLLLGLSNHLIPAVARAANRGVAAARRVVAVDGSAAGAILLVYMVAILLIPVQIMSLIYGHKSPYISSAPLLKWFVVVYAFQFAAALVGAYEGGLGRTTSYMHSQFASLVSLCVAGVPLIFKYGVPGAVVAAVIVYFMRFVVVTALSYRHDQTFRNLQVEMRPDAETSGQPLSPNV
ncbi:MAG TPA: hypothetical protein VH325_05715 [Bryobacteraceae bacterium]|jgi:O-antigen/teichoic acid export membrane protein|nr:hypothetical protein [Bryobacteraceae bacterium]